MPRRCLRRVFSRTRCLTSATRLTAVSYTHLDVYKRQEREAAAYDEQAVMENKQRKMQKESVNLPCG